MTKVLDFARTYAKALVAAGGLLVMVGDGLVTGHFDGPKLFDLIAAFVTAVGVHQVPNKPQTVPVPVPVVVPVDRTPPVA